MLKCLMPLVPVSTHVHRPVCSVHEARGAITGAAPPSFSGAVGREAVAATTPAARLTVALPQRDEPASRGSGFGMVAVLCLRSGGAKFRLVSIRSMVERLTKTGGNIMSGETETTIGYFVATDGQAYENFMGRWSSRLAPLFLEFAGIKAGDQVLDVGCGTGVMTHAAALLGANAVGFDMSEQYLDYARAHRPHQNARYEQGDARKLPYPDNSFGAALTSSKAH
jgi:hypothetical protein